MAFPPEFELALACCRRPLTPAHEAEVRGRAERIDWPFFLKVAARHRIEGLAHDALTRSGVAMPAPAAASLLSAAQGIARENLFYAAEAHRLHERFERAGVGHLFVKGVTLNMLAYGSLALKRSCDIDLLVDPTDYDAACTLLEEAGYACVVPERGSRDEILRYAAAAKDSVWRNEVKSITLELHQRLTANPLLLRGVGPSSQAQWVEVAPGLALPTLAREPLFAYLCAHGAATAWSRLKWSADLAALLAGENQEGIESLYRSAGRLGAGRAADQALLLLQRLFGLALPPALERELSGGLANRMLVRAAMKTMVRGGAATELDGQAWGHASINLSMLFLHPGWRYKYAEVRQKLRSSLAVGRAGPRSTLRPLARVLQRLGR
jgi:hypothetical protein